MKWTENTGKLNLSAPIELNSHRQQELSVDVENSARRENNFAVRRVDRKTVQLQKLI